MANAQQGPTVPREMVKQLALKSQQGATQAQLIRWCVSALKQTPADAQRALERERRHLVGAHRQVVRMHEPAKKVRNDRELALVYLEWLATALENDSLPPPAGLDLT